jgi:hypothetical protein
MQSKFFNISFPFIGLKHCPYDYYIRADTIGIKLSQQSDWVIIDKVIEGKSIISRYLESNPEDFLYDATCLNLTQLISKGLAWGIDSKAKIFDLSTPQIFKARSVPVMKAKADLIWVDTVSYPFKIRKSVLDHNLIIEQYTTIVNIDNEWVLYKFTPFKQDIKEIKL